jgi:hypothetical protein
VPFLLRYSNESTPEIGVLFLFVFARIIGGLGTFCSSLRYEQNTRPPRLLGQSKMKFESKVVE